ncbi:MAG: carboxypeptidase regulatory-like domain-containing protein [Planctomycetes bacterium]|nr:carboxypeptidase regulatory-like domain-containing protein [Planctomycetota bacterium]
MVLDERGAPLPGVRARVAVAPAWGALPSVTTDATGEFDLSGLVPGLHVLSFDAPGRVGKSLADVAAGTLDLEVALLPGRPVSIRLLALPDLASVQNARVIAESGDWSAPAPWDPAAASYRIDGAPVGAFFLAATGDDFVPLLASLDVPAEGPADFELQVEPGRRIWGRILDLANRTPVPGARVEIWNATLGPDTARSVLSSDGGEFAAAGFLPGPLGVRIRAEGYPEYDSDREGDEYLVGMAEEARFEIDLPRGVGIAGRILGPDGSGVEGATVSAREPAGGELASALSREGGGFRIPAAPRVAGLFLFAEAPGLAPARTESLTGIGDEGVEGVEIRLSPGVAVAGKVVGPQGEPVAAVRIVVDLTGHWLGEARPAGMELATDAQGRFRAGPFPPGTVPLLFLHPDYRPSATSLEIPEGAPMRELPLEVRLEPGQALAGQVTDPGGSPVASALVVAEQTVAGAPEGPLASAWTTFDGSFELRSLAPGPVRLRAMAPGYAPSDPEMFAPEKGPVRLVLRRRFSLSGRVELLGLSAAGHEGHEHGPEAIERPEELAAFTVRLVADQPGGKSPPEPVVSEVFEAGEDARFVLTGVPEGIYRLEVIATGYRPASIEPFSPADWVGREIEVRLDPGPIVRGIVVSASTGEPVPGAVLVRGTDLSNFDPVGSEARERVLGWTDADGRFRISGLEAGTEAFSVYHDFYAPALARPAIAEIRVALKDGAVIQGVLLGPEGDSVAGATVALAGPLLKAAETDGSGRFRIEGLATGTYTLSRSDRPPPEGAMELVVAAGSRLEVTFDWR